MAGLAAAARETIFDPGRRLPPQALAQFVVLAGALPDAMASLLGPTTSAAAPPPPDWALPWCRIDLDRAMALGAALETVADVGDLIARLQTLWTSARGSEPLHGLLQGGPPDLDASWLTGLLVQPDVLASAMFDCPQWQANLMDWPLRVGLPPSASGRELAAELEGSWFRELYDPAIVQGRDAVVDILLIPGTLSQALHSARSGVRRHASLVVVLGAFDLSSGLEAMREIAQSWDAAVVTVWGLEPDAWRPCFAQMVAALSHNLPLPVAVFDALRQQLPDGDPHRPVVLGDAEFAERNRPLDVAERLAHQVGRLGDRPLQPPPELQSFSPVAPERSTHSTVADALELAAREWPWSSETQGATMLVRTRRALEAQIGAVELRRDPRFHLAAARMSPPEDPPAAVPPDGLAEAAPPPPRHVKFDLRSGRAGEAHATPPSLTPDATLRLEVFVAEAGVAAQGTADAPLDESQLPPSDSGHNLDIVYCPLSPVGEVHGRPDIPPPVRATLQLPRRGTSTRASFDLRCGASVADFRARLIVLHAQRVLQSLLLTSDADGHPSLSVENRYAPGFDSPSADVPADLAFLINDNPDGVAGLTTMAGDRASFITPDGLKESITQMRKILSAAVQAEVGATTPGLDRPALLDLMRQLANHGAVIVEELSMQHPLQQLDAARRVQVVEAVDQAYFPVEYLYAGPAPEPQAALCPNALAALGDGGDAVHDQCPHRHDEGHVCPASFWGFRKCIERHPPNGDAATVLSVPEPGQERLGPFASALLAASDRARDEMSGPQGLPATLSAQVPDLTTATSWADWKTQVLARPHDLLVLMPHSDKSSVFAGIPSLEVSKDELAASNLTEKYVQVGGAHGPLVLLLGCSTSFADLPFLNFVRRFHLKGAPAVVGTLSVIHATQAHHIARRLLDLALAPDSQALRLDEALLQLRRHLLAEGNGVSFTLMAYGHSAWRL